ncbi:hypothetical protein CPC08DRAFT_704526 [Agrocybe pediades]|nr:hypothetical protein CPC08DRAFT_704526 [Agrocybe pediades]
MLAFLWLVFVCRLGLATFMGMRLNARLKVTTPSLGTDTLPQDVLTSYSIGELLVQCLLLSLLLTRGGRTPIMSRLVASGIIELGVITIFIVGGNLAFAWRSKLYAFNYPTFVAVVSSLASRLILSSERAYAGQLRGHPLASAIEITP